jgi:hypothetical protein
MIIQKTIRINQLPVAAYRWQDNSKKCFATFIQQIHKIANYNNSVTTEVKEKIAADFEFLRENFI